jgi:hypothetical protein
LCVLGGDDFAGRVLPVMATQPADVPFLGMPIAVAVDVHAHFDPIDVLHVQAALQIRRFPKISLGGLLVKIRIHHTVSPYRAPSSASTW